MGPIAFDLSLGDFEDVGHLFHRQTTEEPQLNNARLLRIQGGQGFKYVV